MRGGRHFGVVFLVLDMKAVALACLFLIILGVGCSESGEDVDDLPPLPNAISELPIGIVVEPTESIADAVRHNGSVGGLSSIPNPVHRWDHPLKIRALTEDVQILEYGVFFWDGSQWVDGTEEQKPYTAQGFTEVFECRDAVLRAGESYTSDHFSNFSNVSTNDPVYYRWYFIGETKDGRCRGEVTLVDMPPQEQF